MGIGFLWAIVLGVGILFFSDTPRYLYRHGKKDEAKAIMQKVYGAPPNHFTIHVEMEEIEAKLRAESNVSSAPVLSLSQRWRPVLQSLAPAIRSWVRLLFQPHC